MSERITSRHRDQYWYWQAKLAGEDPNPPEDRTWIPSGFWRLRNSEPLAVWREDGAGAERTYALRGFEKKRRMMQPLDMESMAESGSFGHAVTETAYREAYTLGHWPADEPPPLAPPPRPGSNLPSDPFEQIKAELESEIELTEELLERPIADQATADKLASWSRRVGQLAKRADEEHDLEKAPHLEAGKAVDEKWRAVRGEARSLVDRLKAHVGIWLRKLKREAEEKEREAREAARALREQAEQERSPLEAAELEAEAAAIEQAAEPARIIAGRPNLRVSLRTVRSARIVDYDKAVEALKFHREMKELVQRLADRAVKAGVDVPGVGVIEEQVPR
jgi:hypothetical protein